MKRFRNILVVMNSDGLANAVTARAKWLAEANGARLTLLSVNETRGLDLNRLSQALPAFVGELKSRVDDVLKSDMDEAAGLLRRDGISVEQRTAAGVGFVEVIKQVLRGGHDLVLKGAEVSFDWRTLGGADLHLLRKCPCPVWIINQNVDAPTRRIMAAIDPGPGGHGDNALDHQILQMATSLAAQDNAKLDVLNAWYLYEEHLLRGRKGRTPPEQVDALLEETRRKSRWHFDQFTAGYAAVVPDMERFHIKGIPADVIVHHAEEQRIDTLVMGTLGRTGLPGMFIGNTAETIFNRVECSVLAVKPRDFVSPIKL